MATCINLEDIESFEYVECNEVYDITVEDSHCYYIDAEGLRMLVHNSSKTTSICQVGIFLPFKYKMKGQIFDICRKTQAELHDTVMMDFFHILEENNLYNRRMHNKTHGEYEHRGVLYRFLGLDKAQKKRGTKRDLLYVNEANGITLEDWIQLNIRLTGKAFVDHNPSETYWVHDLADRRSDVRVIKSSYLDSYDFLSEKQIREIEDLVNVDDFYYQVYTLGNLAVMKGQIYQPWDGNKGYRVIDIDDYNVIDYQERFYGLDWGYEHPAALVELKYAQENIYTRQLYHKSHQTDDQLIEWMLRHDISQTDTIYADPAYPASIYKLRDAGFNVVKAKKDVLDGIRFCQSSNTFITSDSHEFMKLRKRYKWRQKSDGTLLTTDPVKLYDDLEDAFRYGAYTRLKYERET